MSKKRLEQNEGSIAGVPRTRKTKSKILRSAGSSTWSSLSVSFFCLGRDHTDKPVPSRTGERACPWRPAWGRASSMPLNEPGPTHHRSVQQESPRVLAPIPTDRKASCRMALMGLRSPSGGFCLDQANKKTHKLPSTTGVPVNVAIRDIKGGTRHELRPQGPGKRTNA